MREDTGGESLGGVIYVFPSKARPIGSSCCSGDGTGLVLAAKRLEEGSFRWPSLRDGVMRLTPAQLSALLEGLDWARVRGVRTLKPKVVS